MITIERRHAEKVVELCGFGLVSGLGQPEPGKMCVEAAVNYALGRPHGDDPECVSASLRQLQIRLNDASWSSTQARGKGLRRLAVAQLGSLGMLDEAAFRRRVVEMTIRTMVPVGLRAAATVNPTYAADLEAAAVRCEQDGTRDACEAARHMADACAAASAASADAAYAAYAAYAAAASADSYAAAAAAAAAAADADAAAAAAAARTRDRVLAEYAEHVVQILIAMGAPGCQWLDLVPLEAA